MKRIGVPTIAVLALALLSSCGERQVVKLGAVLPLTGPSPEIAQSIKNGLDLAFEQLQADETIPYELELDVRDSGGDAQKAAQLADELYDGANAIVGGVTTEEALAMAEVSKREEKVLLSPSAIGDQLSGVSRTFYRLFPTALQQASAMANFAKERLDVSDLVILIQEDRAFTRALVEGLRSVFTQYGGKVVAEIPFDPTSDLGPIVDQALESQPTGIYLASSGATTAQLVKLLRERGYGRSEGKSEWIMTNSAFAHPAFLGRAGSDADGVYLTAPLFDLESQETPIPEFVAAYRQKYGQDPDLYAGHGYDSLLIFGAALKKTTNTLPAEFQKGMRSFGSVAGVTGTLQFNENGDVQKFPRVDIIREGKLVDFQSWLKQRMEDLRRRREEILQQSIRMRDQSGATGDSEQ